MRDNPNHTPSKPPTLDPTERVGAGDWLLLAAAALVAAALALAVCGCVFRGAKITEGTDLAVGLTVPGTEGMVQLNALNWLSGFRLGVAENAALEVEYSAAETNSFFGCVETRTAKRIKAKVEPCESQGGAALSRAEGASPRSPSPSAEEGGEQ